MEAPLIPTKSSQPVGRSHVRCIDCGCPIEDMGQEVLRCPWATATVKRRVWLDSREMLACNQPYTTRPDSFEAPITGVLKR